jgi:hypothetical protein
VETGAADANLASQQGLAEGSAEFAHLADGKRRERGVGSPQGGILGLDLTPFSLEPVTLIDQKGIIETDLPKLDVSIKT